MAGLNCLANLGYKDKTCVEYKEVVREEARHNANRTHEAQAGRIIRAINIMLRRHP